MSTLRLELTYLPPMTTNESPGDARIWAKAMAPGHPLLPERSQLGVEASTR
jgi:hypothetical protein